MFFFPCHLNDSDRLIREGIDLKNETLMGWPEERSESGFHFSIKCRNSDDAWAFLTQHLTLEYRVSVFALVNKYTTLTNLWLHSWMQPQHSNLLIHTAQGLSPTPPLGKVTWTLRRKIGYLKWKFGFESTMDLTLNSLLAPILFSSFLKFIVKFRYSLPSKFTKKI